MSSRLVRSSLKGCPVPMARLRLSLCRRFCSYCLYFWCICSFRVPHSCSVSSVKVLNCSGCLDNMA